MFKIPPVGYKRQIDGILNMLSGCMNVCTHCAMCIRISSQYSTVVYNTTIDY